MSLFWWRAIVANDTLTGRVFEGAAVAHFLAQCLIAIHRVWWRGVPLSRKPPRYNGFRIWGEAGERITSPKKQNNTDE